MSKSKQLGLAAAVLAVSVLVPWPLLAGVLLLSNKSAAS